MSDAAPCRICGGSAWSVLYEGPIRVGRHPNYTTRDHPVLRCDSCFAGFLDVEAIDYASAAYRELVDGETGTAAFFADHDAEQTPRLEVVGTPNVRGRVVADVGCGGGSFLDHVQGLATRTLAIDPARAYHEDLASRGHEVFSYATEAAAAHPGGVDLITCWQVIEHLDEPQIFLKQLRELASPVGQVWLSTPNGADWLLEVAPSTYRRFFYRKVHTWYFDAQAMTRLAELSGFRVVETTYRHRFDLSNALLWIRDGKPTGQGKLDVLSPLDGVFRDHLIRTGRADTLFVRLEPA